MPFMLNNNVAQYQYTSLFCLNKHRHKTPPWRDPSHLKNPWNFVDIINKEFQRGLCECLRMFQFKNVQVIIRVSSRSKCRFDHPHTFYMYLLDIWSQFWIYNLLFFHFNWMKLNLNCNIVSAFLKDCAYG